MRFHNCHCEHSEAIHNPKSRFRDSIAIINLAQDYRLPRFLKESAMTQKQPLRHNDSQPHTTELAQ